MKSVSRHLARRAPTPISVLRVLAIVVSCVSVIASRPTVAVQAAAEDPHWLIEMPVDGPTNIGDPFVVQLTLRLVGPPVGTFVSAGVLTTYSVMAIRPDGTKWIMSDHATQQGYAVGSVERVRLSLAPTQTGEWTFRVEQYVGAATIVAAESRVFTDKVPEAVATADPQAVGGLRVDPPKPVVGQPATITIEMADQPLAAIIRQVPVELIDDDGIQELGTVTSPGAGGTATLAWVPQQATEHGVLHAVDQSTNIVVLEAAADADASDAGVPVDDDGGTEPDQYLQPAAR
jgi:hypothetical protein